MRSWSRADRIGARLAAEIGVNGERIDRVRIYTLDVELWHPGLAELARQKMAELQALVNQGRGDRERSPINSWETCWLWRASVFREPSSSNFSMPR